MAAACGDDESDTASAETEAPAQPTTPPAEATDAPAPTTAPAGEYDRTGWPDSISFAIVPAEEADNVADYVTPRIIADELGLELKVEEAADYAGVIEGMIAERVDVGAFGPFAYVIATGAGANIDLAGIWSGDTADTYGDYKSFLLVPTGSDIRTPADLKGHTVCFVDPGSASGFLFPSQGLIEAGIDPNEGSADITPIFAGGHDASVLAILDGTCDAGYAYDTMVTQQLIESGDLAGVIDASGDPDKDDTVNADAAELEIVWKSTAIAAPPLAVGKWLPETLQAAIKDVVLTKINVDWAADNGYCPSTDLQECELSDGAFWGYLPEDDSYFDGIRELCDITGAEQCKL